MKKLVVRATSDVQPDSGWVHRFRNFGEDAWRELREDSEISLDEIDRSTTEFTVGGLHSRRVGRTKQALRKLIDSHGFTDQVVILDATSAAT